MVDTLFGEKNRKKHLDEIKARLQKNLVLSMPDKRGRFTLYSDTSKHATGSALYQIQDESAKANCLWRVKECLKQQRIIP